MSSTIYGPEKTPEEIAKIVEQTENSDKKIYPILKPGNWVGLRAGAISSNLIGTEEDGDLEVVIAYGMDTPDNFVFLTHDHLKTMDGQFIMNEAFENIDNYNTEFEYSKALQNKVLTASGHDFSSERILSKSHMLKAHKMLEADELLVSIPRRSCMMVISKDADNELLNTFLYLHKNAWEDDSYGNAPIANIFFVVKDGEITGHAALS
ncbi:hypothetical protein FNB79_11205 [Formosa sediminum]|uniref:DUF1444 family protein n=1 Tax=Formosa sediminum TaxID=2594004 RepID=A0A516GSN1_9FLAO|nr:DUF1444 family protein [Formosa sediminum]QDO94508.1 hypothetical protein FNB79_11205 [Formosa sediminum]